MNTKLFVLFIALSVYANFSASEKLAEQKEFDEALGKYLETRVPKFSVSDVKVKKHARRSSPQAKLLHDIFTFEQKYNAKKR